MEDMSTKELISYTYIRILEIVFDRCTPKKCCFDYILVRNVQNIFFTIIINVKNPTSRD